MPSQSDPLLVAITRPAMTWGVTLEGIIIAGAIVGIVMIATGNPLSLLLYIPLHATMYFLCLRDPRTFRLILLWGNTKVKSLGWRHWGASTASPQRNTRAKREMPQ